MRTNAGYDRWWEARKLWGGIVNQSRNLALLALAHGPADERWRQQFVRWTAAFPYVARAKLRGEREVPELTPLLGEEQACAGADGRAHALLRGLADRRIAARGLRPLRHGSLRLLAGGARALRLIDHLGGCERIRNTPLATVYSITIRRFILIYLATLPFALLHKFEDEWLAPLATFLLAYSVLALDQIGIELQQPFSSRSLNHLPLHDICQTIREEPSGPAARRLESPHSRPSLLRAARAACNAPG